MIDSTPNEVDPIIKGLAPTFSTTTPSVSDKKRRLSENFKHSKIASKRTEATLLIQNKNFETETEKKSFLEVQVSFTS